MQHRTIAFLVSFALVAMSGSALAQTDSRPRTAVIASAPPRPTANGAKPRLAIIPPSPPAQPTTPHPTTFGTNFISPVHVVRFDYLPTVVLSDGRVLADFGTGRGYEQVLRQCPRLSGPLPYGATIAPCWTVDAYGRYNVIQQR